MTKTLERTLYQNVVLDGINRILVEAFKCETEEDLGRICLSVAEEVTNSRFGFIGEVREGVLNGIAISDPGWVACTMGGPSGHRTLPTGLKVHGIYGRVLRDGKGFYTNNPASHPDRIGLPEGHPPLEAFLGIPLTHEGKTIGMVGVANRPGGYSQEHLEALEKMAPAITQSLMHKRSDAALRISESKYRTLFNSIDEGFFLIDVLFDEHGRPVDLYYAEANDAATRILGQDYKGKRLTELSPGYERYWFEIFGDVARTGRSVRLERYADPDKRWYSFYVFKVGPAESRRVGNTFMDITARKRMEQDLRESEEMVRSQLAEIEAIYRSAPVGMCVFDRDLRFVRVNDRLAEINGIPPEDHLGKSVREIVPDLADLAGSIVERIVRTGKPELNVEFSGTTQSQPGEERCWVENWLPLKDDSGDVVGINVVAEEITERKRAIRELKDSHERLYRTLESITDGFLSLDREWRYTYFNETGARMVGMKPEDLLGKVVWDLFPHAEGTKFHTEYHRAAATNTPVHFEEFYPAPLNRWLECHCYPSPEGLSVYFRDITERRRMEEELRRSRDVLELRVRERTAELQRKNQELQEFAFVASHDLSEPLRKIRTFGSILQEKISDRLSEVERDYISRMSGAAVRMQELLDALLRYSRVETKGKEFITVGIEDVVRSVETDLEVSIRKLGARLEIGRLPVISGDPYQWRQVFQNLVANALKYHRPEVKTVIKVYAGENNGKAQIFVEDNGIGFDEKYLEKIFQPFQRLHGRLEYPGTGIGLAICKKIVERHGGTITARSSPGKGSTFIMTLPVNRG